MEGLQARTNKQLAFFAARLGGRRGREVGEGARSEDRRQGVAFHKVLLSFDQNSAQFCIASRHTFISLLFPRVSAGSENHSETKFGGFVSIMQCLLWYNFVAPSNELNLQSSQNRLPNHKKLYPCYTLHIQGNSMRWKLKVQTF